MSKITITAELDPNLAMVLASITGWTPMIEDTEAELIEDKYPEIPNPITLEKHLGAFIPDYVGKAVSENIQKSIQAEIDSIKANLDDQIRKGAFNNVALTQGITGVKSIIKASL